MNIKPRCRTWIPLSTQQLRLRNLVRIEGVNIDSNDDMLDENTEIFIFYTLHDTKESEAFYMSEPLPRHHLQQKWAEITCNEMLKSNSNCVCVKVWARLNRCKSLEHETENMELKEEQLKEPISALPEMLSNISLSPSTLPRPPDKLLFVWGVYFSGLVPLKQQTDAKCNVNSLIFQLNGDFFASPEHFTVESLREQISLNYDCYSASVPKTTIPPSSDNFAINSPHVSRSSSPVPIEWQQRDMLRMSKARYIQLHCPRNEVRKSYNLEKLLQIQELQRLHLQKTRETFDIAVEIKRLSVHCITSEQLKRKPRTTSLSSTNAFHQYHSMGRTLSVLLAEQQEINPRTLLHAQKLQQQVETLRCKKRLLQSEYETYAKRIATLRQNLNSVTESRQQLQTWLSAKQTDLQYDKQSLLENNTEEVTQKLAKRQIIHNVERRMSALCMELKEIYPISCNQLGLHTICDIPLPNFDSYVNDEKYANSICLETISPMALSASLGYIAHLVQMIAVIINRPLRNPILHEGSRTRIMDIVKEIPYTSREFPLYTRSTIPSKLVKYAIYLLNQNIAQLCYDITGIRCDLRATIDNILLIFATLAEIEKSQREPHAPHSIHPSKRLNLYSNSNNKNCIDADNDDNVHVVSNGNNRILHKHDNDCLSKSHSSVDMNHVPLPISTKVLSTLIQLPNSQPIPIIERNSSQQRICRSVGSYSDCEDDFKDITNHCYSNSDSNIPFQSEHV